MLYAGAESGLPKSEPCDPFWSPRDETAEYDEGLPGEDEERTDTCRVRDALLKFRYLRKDPSTFANYGRTERRLRQFIDGILENMEILEDVLDMIIDDTTPFKSLLSAFDIRRDTLEVLEEAVELLREVDELKMFGGELDISLQLRMEITADKLLSM